MWDADATRSSSEPHPWSLFPARDRHSCNCGCGSRSDFPFWVQTRLAQFIPSGVPQTGVIGRVTRRAIRIFQFRNQLPPTGLLDHATVEALRSVEPYSPSLDRDDDVFGLLFGRHEEAGEQELSIMGGSCEVTVAWNNSIDLGVISKASGLGRRDVAAMPGIYAIHDGHECWYVGKATRSIRERFEDRWKVFRDFHVSDEDRDRALNQLLAGKTLYCAQVASSCSGIKIGEKNRSAKKFTEIANLNSAILAIVEQSYIVRFGTTGKGNIQPNSITEVKGTVTIKQKQSPPWDHDGEFAVSVEPRLSPQRTKK